MAGAPFAEVLDYGERRMRAVLADLPDGAWSFTDVIDCFGPAPDQQIASTITVTVTIAGEAITFDFTGSDPQRRRQRERGRGRDRQLAWPSPCAAAIDPTLPANGGALRPVTVIAPAGTVVNALAPAAVGAGNVEVSQRVADVCFGALAQVRPGLIGAASQGTMNNVLIGNDRWVYYETIAGGQGGRPFRRGMSGVHTHMTNTRNTPVEALERAFPLRVRRLRLRRGSGGAGRHPGGDGIERDLEVLEAATLSLITERRRSAPWGLEGGGPGAVGENWLLPGGDEADAAPAHRQDHPRSRSGRRRADPDARRRRVGRDFDARGPCCLGSPAMDLNNISAIVTGGASGIGEAVARQLAGRGAKVVIADLQDEKGNALASEIGGAFAHVDVTNTDDVIAAVELAKEMGPLRALVNSAGDRLGHPHDRQGRRATTSAHDLEVSTPRSSRST